MPASLPSIFTGLRVGLGIGWTAVIVSEMVAVKSGLGYVLWDAYYVGRMDVVIADMASIGLLGFLSDRLIIVTRKLGAGLAPHAIVPSIAIMGTVSFRATSKTFPGKVPVRALDDITLEIKDGEFVALLGPSGCGKSTLLNLLAGFETRSSGELTFDGAPIDKPGPDRGVVFQEASLFPWLNVWDNITFGPRVQGLRRDEYESKARAMLKLVGLEAFAHALPAQLSGGMRQRVGIARVLVMNPRALLMDEPFGALDAQTRLAMQQLLLDVWQTLGTTVLFVTHDIDESILLADRICIMSARPGRITREIAVGAAAPALNRKPDHCSIRDLQGRDHGRNEDRTRQIAGTSAPDRTTNLAFGIIRPWRPTSALRRAKQASRDR